MLYVVALRDRYETGETGETGGGGGNAICPVQPPPVSVGLSTLQR